MKAFKNWNYITDFYNNIVPKILSHLIKMNLKLLNLHRAEFFSTAEFTGQSGRKKKSWQHWIFCLSPFKDIQSVKKCRLLPTCLLCYIPYRIEHFFSPILINVIQLWRLSCTQVVTWLHGRDTIHKKPSFIFRLGCHPLNWRWVIQNKMFDLMEFRADFHLVEFRDLLWPCGVQDWLWPCRDENWLSPCWIQGWFWPCGAHGWLWYCGVQG